MRILSNVCFKDVSGGDLVKSMYTGNMGTIIEVRFTEKYYGGIDYYIYEYLIEWMSGSWSLIETDLCDQIQYLGPETI